MNEATDNTIENEWRYGSNESEWKKHAQFAD